jgi:hypothetical protein
VGVLDSIDAKAALVSAGEGAAALVDAWLAALQRVAAIVRGLWKR